MAERPTAIVYIDGLNLYRQKLTHHSACKWLDLVKFAELMLPTHEIRLVRYFTTEVKPAATDNEAPVRQRIYWRALETLGERVTIHEGKMRTDNRWLPKVPREYRDGKIVKVKVQKVEEKGGDVALASYMVLDAATNPADVHVLVSSDSDFKPTLLLLRQQLGVATGLFSPIESPAAALLETDPLFTKVIRRTVLEASQFPDELTDAKGAFSRPRSWQ